MRGPLRILMVLDSFFPDSHGGAERMVEGWSRELAARGDEICVLAGRIGTSAGPDERMSGFRIRRWISKRRSFKDGYLSALFACAMAARKLAKEWRPDIVHCHQGLSAYAVSRARIPFPAVYTFHGPWRDEFMEDARAKEETFRPGIRAIYRLATRFKAARIHRMEGDALARSQAVSVMSEFSRDLLVSGHGIFPGSVEIFRGGVDLDHFYPVPDGEREDIRRRLGFTGLTILSVRRLVRRTGIDLLLKAMVQVCSRIPNVSLVLAGKGSERDALERMAGELGLGRAVRFAGFVSEEELPDYYRAADLFILPTRSLEGFGMSTLEALASGTPVVGTPAGATPEILSPLEKGLVAFETSPHGISKAALPWLSFPSALRDLRPRCRQYAETHYRWSDAGSMLRDSYLRVIEKRNPRG
ncbi:glycosyltransferase family 4 protein [Nitrospinota bacterium]